MEKCTASIRLVKFPDPIQGKLPIKPDAIRGSERIRARAYRDPRLTGTTMLVVLAISEFVTGRGQPAARLKLATIRKWTHGKDRVTRSAVREAAELGVFEVDRKRTCQRYVFKDSWIDWFGAVSEPLSETAARDAETDVRSADSASLRSADSASQDRQILPITVEPVLVNTKQQQQGGVLLPSPAQSRGIASMARELGEDAPQPATRAEADVVFRGLKLRVSGRRTKASRELFAVRRASRHEREYAERLQAQRGG